MKKLILLSFLVSSLAGIAKDDSTKVKTKFSGFLDAYYAYDVTNPNARERQAFLYNHNENNSLSVNLALLQFEAETDNFHSVIALQAGDYVKYNLSHEPTAMRNIFEAYGGFRPCKKMWIDVGIFGSNLGFESAISTENITLTRSLVAENSPYYLSGVRFIYEANKKWTFTGLVSNGWQLIQDNNSAKAFGTQVEFSPNDDFLVNYSTFIGDEGNGLRIFNDFYIKKKFSDKLNGIICLDYGMEEDRSWLGTAALLQYVASEKSKLGIRAEYFKDDNYVVIASLPFQIFDQFNTSGFSLNYDYKPNKFTTWRTEVRSFLSSNNVFPDGFTSNMNFSTTLVTSLAFKF